MLLTQARRGMSVSTTSSLIQLYRDSLNTLDVSFDSVVHVLASSGEARPDLFTTHINTTARAFRRLRAAIDTIREDALLIRDARPRAISLPTLSASLRNSHGDDMVPNAPESWERLFVEGMDLEVHEK